MINKLKEEEKIKMAILALEELLEANLFDYCRGGEMSNNFWWNEYDLRDLSEKLNKYLYPPEK